MSRQRQQEISWASGPYPFIGFTAFFLFSVAGLLFVAYLLDLFRWPITLSWYTAFLLTVPIIEIIVIFSIAWMLLQEARMSIYVRKRSNAQYVDFLVREQTAYLLCLRSIAQWENARKYLWSRRHQPGPQPSLTELCETLPIARFAGFYSLYFTVLSWYLQLPLPESGALVVEGSLVTIQENVAREGAESATEATPPPFLAIDRDSPMYAISFFNTTRLQVCSSSLTENLPLEDFPLKVGSPQELLAYLALVASEKTILGENIRHDIYEEKVSLDEDTGQTEDKLSNDAKAIRQFFRRACRRVAIPYVDPIKSGRGKGTVWSLNSIYVFLDIARMKELAQRLPELKQQQVEGERKAVRIAYEGVISSFGSGLLGHLKQSGRLGPWIEPYFNRYQEMYRQLLWDIAEWEERGSHQTSEPEEQEECLRRAAQWYERCALAHIPTQEQEEEGWPAGQVHIGELALQRSMEFYGQLKETIAAERIFTTYRDRMLALNENYSIEKPTNQMYKRVTGSTQQ